MAAFANVSANLVKHAVKTRLMDATPAAGEAFRRLFSWLAQHKGKNDLQLLNFTATDGATAGGVVLGSGVARVYAFYVKKTATATQNTMKLYDDATDDTTAGNAIAALDLRAANEEAWEIYPNGKLLATGLVITDHTTLLGTVDGSAANGGNGFVIIG